MVDNLNIHLVQYSPQWGLYKENLARLDNLLTGLKLETRNSKLKNLILLPEMFPTGFYVGMDQATVERSATESLMWMQQLAKTTGAMVMGSMAVQDGGHCYNRCYCVSPVATSHYDKRHLFSMSEEGKYFSAGQDQLMVEWSGWQIKPIVCYDLRFPAWSRNNTVKPYDLLVCVASWPAARQDAWFSLLKARAIENQSYAVGINRTGVDGNGLVHKGNSIVFSPKGEVIGQLDSSEQVASFSLSHQELMDFRKKFPVLPDMDKFVFI